MDSNSNTPVTKLIYYCCVATIRRNSLSDPGYDIIIIADYCTNGDRSLPDTAANCLQLLPPYHTRFSFTTNTKMLACIIDGDLLYSAIADEALPRSTVMRFLEQVKQEFTSLAWGLDLTRVRNRGLSWKLQPALQRLVEPLVGVTQNERNIIEAEIQAQKEAAKAEEARGAENGEFESSYADSDDRGADYVSSNPPITTGFEYPYMSSANRSAGYESYNHFIAVDKSSGSRSPSVPLITKTSSNKYKQKKLKEQARDSHEDKIENKVHRVEILVENGNQLSSGSGTSIQKLSSMKGRGQQIMARKIWCRNVKFILIIDVIVCVILFVIWLGVCNGLACVKKNGDS